MYWLCFCGQVWGMFCLCFGVSWNFVMFTCLHTMLHTMLLTLYFMFHSSISISYSILPLHFNSLYFKFYQDLVCKNLGILVFYFYAILNFLQDHRMYLGQWCKGQHKHRHMHTHHFRYMVRICMFRCMFRIVCLDECLGFILRKINFPKKYKQHHSKYFS
jgi:hypothetical protein